MNKQVPRKWDEMTYPFTNLGGATVEVYEWISNFIPHLDMLGLKLIYVSKLGHIYQEMKRDNNCEVS